MTARTMLCGGAQAHSRLRDNLGASIWARAHIGAVELLT